MKKSYVIFGRNTANVLGQVRSFGEAGIKTDVIWYGERPEPIKASKYLNKLYEVDCFEQGLQLLIEKYGNVNNPSVLSTDNDGVVAFLDQNYNKLKDKFVFFNAGEEGRLTKYMTKMEQCRIAQECGICIPMSEIVQIGQMPTKIKYPVFTKLLDSFDINWKDGVSICRNESELREYYSRMSLKSQVLLQEYIEKKNEYILQGISFDSGRSLFLPIEGGYYRLPKDAYGSYLYFNKYRGGDELKSKLQKMFAEIKYSGVFEIEFLLGTDNQLYFLEINFRHTLWNHTFTDMGINLCDIWAKYETGEDVSLSDLSIRKEPHNLMREFLDFKRCREDGSRTLLGWLKDLANTDSFVMWDKKDIKPFFCYCWSLAKDMLKKLINV